MEAISARNNSNTLPTNSKFPVFIHNNTNSKQKTKHRNQSPPTPPLRSDLNVTLNPGYEITSSAPGTVSVLKPKTDGFLQINTQIRKAAENAGQIPMPTLQDRVAHRSYDNHPSPVMPLKEKEIKLKIDDASTSSVGNSSSSIATLSRQQSAGPGSHFQKPVNNLSREMLQQEQFEPVSQLAFTNANLANIPSITQLYSHCST